MELPKIGETVTTEQARALCLHFGLGELVDRIDAHPERYRSWKFDGCSGLPDEALGLFTGCNWQDITYRCCLPHDLRYAYGEPGNESERKGADDRFFADLVQQAGMKQWMAAAFLAGVRIGGAEAFGVSFSWGFADRSAGRRRRKTESSPE